MCGNDSGGHIRLRRGGGLFLGLTSLSWREASGYSLASCESMQGRLFLGLDLTLLDGVEPDAFVLPVLELVALGPIVAHGIRENVTSVVEINGVDGILRGKGRWNAQSASERARTAKQAYIKTV